MWKRSQVEQLTGLTRHMIQDLCNPNTAGDGLGFWQPAIAKPGYSRFDEGDLLAFYVVRQLVKAGFTLREVEPAVFDLLESGDAFADTLHAKEKKLQARRAELDDKLATLSYLEDAAAAPSDNRLLTVMEVALQANMRRAFADAQDELRQELRGTPIRLGDAEKAGDAEGIGNDEGTRGSEGAESAEDVGEAKSTLDAEYAGGTERTVKVERSERVELVEETADIEKTAQAALNALLTYVMDTLRGEETPASFDHRRYEIAQLIEEDVSADSEAAQQATWALVQAAVEIGAGHTTRRTVATDHGTVAGHLDEIPANTAAHLAYTRASTLAMHAWARFLAAAENGVPIELVFGEGSFVYLTRSAAACVELIQVTEKG